jgi:cysteinyl-tRNA synthetase
MSVLFDAVREGNRRIDLGKDPAPLAAAFDEIVEVLGFEPPRSDLSGLETQIAGLMETLGISAEATAGANVDRLLSERDEARSRSEWARADAVRNGLAALGIVVEDTPDGARWHRG